MKRRKFVSILGGAGVAAAIPIPELERPKLFYIAHYVKIVDYAALDVVGTFRKRVEVHESPIYNETLEMEERILNGIEEEEGFHYWIGPEFWGRFMKINDFPVTDAFIDGIKALDKAMLMRLTLENNEVFNYSDVRICVNETIEKVYDKERDISRICL